MSLLARRLAAISVLLLSLAIVAVPGLRWMGVQTGTELVASPTPVAATATPQPSGAASSPDLLTAFGQIEEQVRELRGLPGADIGPPQILTRAELAETLPDLLEPAVDNATLRALGLLDAGQDVVALTEQLYLAQVLGYYDFDARQMVVVTDAGRPRPGSPTPTSTPTPCRTQPSTAVPPSSRSRGSAIVSLPCWGSKRATRPRPWCCGRSATSRRTSWWGSPRRRSRT
jgi:hypothetical protein